MSTSTSVFKHQAALQSQLEPGEENNPNLPAWFDHADRVKKTKVDLGPDEEINALATRVFRMLLGQGFHNGNIDEEGLIEDVFNIPEEDGYDADKDFWKDPVTLGLIDNTDVADAEYDDLLSKAPTDWRVRAVAGWAVGWLSSRGYEECCYDMADFAAEDEPNRKHAAEDSSDNSREKKVRTN